MLFDCKVDPNKYTYTSVLKACSAVKNVGLGKQVHGHVIKSGVDDNVFVCNTLIHMYGKFKIACKVFDEMSERDVISWNAVLSAYVDMGMMELACGLYDDMPERNVDSGNIMISGYVKDGLVIEARRVFDGMLVKDIVSWNWIIKGYAHVGDFDQVFRLFEDMRKVEMVPDDDTYVIVLSCASAGGLNQGERVHGYIHKNKIEVGGFLAAALAVMYSKCTFLDSALGLFYVSLKDASIYCSTITDLQFRGFDELALGLLKLFNNGYAQYCLKPNEFMFVSVLSHLFDELVAEGLTLDEGYKIFELMVLTYKIKPTIKHYGCMIDLLGRVGLLKEVVLSCMFHELMAEGRTLDEGYKIFELMVHTHKIKPTIEHYGCMVNFLGRFGLLKEAEKLAKEVPFEEARIVWESLLGACRRHNDVEMAERVANKLLNLDPLDSDGYVQYLIDVHET